MARSLGSNIFVSFSCHIESLAFPKLNVGMSR